MVGICSFGGELVIDKKMVLRQMGAKIAYFRTLTGMTQSELAKKVKVTQSAISKVESGSYHNNLNISLMLDIAEAMDIDPALLMNFSAYEKAMWSNRIEEF